jgi:glycosyltransferase involved in cell wall biosynthesis
VTNKLNCMITSRNKNIVFFVPEWQAGSSGIAHSRILSMASRMNELDYNCLYIGCDETVEQCETAAKLIENTYKIKSYIAPLFSKENGYFGIQKTALKLETLAVQAIEEFQPTHVYAQSILSSIGARRLSRRYGAEMIFDVQGALAEEVAMRRTKWSPRYWYIRWLEGREIKLADRLGCVSYKMRDFIYGLVGRQDAVVIPSCFDENKFFFDGDARQLIRTGFEWQTHNKVIAYSGGLSVWQRIKDIINLFEEIHQLDASFRFLLITPQPDQLTEWLRQSKLTPDCFQIVSCAQTEVRRYLSAADAGIIMRHNTVVNNVASPIKVGEYLACGLPLLLTQGIGDYSRTIPEAGLGILLDEGQDCAKQAIDYIRMINPLAHRTLALQFSKEHLSVRSFTNAYKALFE